MRTKIVVKKVTHRQRQRLALIFQYDEELISQVKRIPGIQWSKTMGCWHVPVDTNVGKYLKALIKDGSTTSQENESEKKRNIAPVSGHNKRAIGRFRSWMAQRRYSKVTIKHYESKMFRFFGIIGKKWEDVTVEDIEKYSYNHYVKPGSKRGGYSSQNIFISALKLFYKSNRSEVLVPEDIKRPIKRRRLPTVLSESEIRRLLRVTTNLKHRALLMLIYSAGLRIGETLQLRITDVDSQRRVVEVHQGKGHKDRRVPLSRKVLELLREYFRIYRPEKYLFEGMRQGRPYSPKSAQQVLQRAVRRAGITKRVTLHTLRHSYATHLMERGVGLRYIQEILGHQSPKTTMIYTHVSGKRLRDIVSPLDEMDI